MKGTADASDIRGKRKAASEDVEGEQQATLEEQQATLEDMDVVEQGEGDERKKAKQKDIPPSPSRIPCRHTRKRG